ncbi:MAG: diguanylate cyclase [Hylemonella sp.]
MHTPTLLLVNILVTAVLGVGMGIVARRSRRDGMVWWAWAMGAQMLTYLLFALRGQISDWLSVVLANTLLVATFALFAEGLCEFQKRPARRWLIWGPVLAMPLLVTLLMNHLQVRPQLVTLLLSFQSLVLLQLIIERRHTTPGGGQYFVVAGLVMIILALLLRFVAALSGQVDLNQVTASHPAHAFSVLMSTLIIVLIAMGLVLMTKEQADVRNHTLAMQDDLTGLNNRRSIQQVLTQQIALARRSQRPLALLLIDIDHFKQINDTHGHLSGDKVLRDVAVCLRERLRLQDMVGRWGGEEFIAILPDTDAAGAQALAEALRVATEQASFSSIDDQPIPMTISIGLHVLALSSGNQRDDMIGAADRALYLAKQNGRNRVEQL